MLDDFMSQVQGGAGDGSSDFNWISEVDGINVNRFYGVGRWTGTNSAYSYPGADGSVTAPDLTRPFRCDDRSDLQMSTAMLGTVFQAVRRANRSY